MYNCSWGDSAMDFAFKLRSAVFSEWLETKCSVSTLCRRYGFSRKWFYKYKKRFLKDGFKGLKNMLRRKPDMPHAMPLDVKMVIMNYVYDNPTHGCKRISMELKVKDVSVSEGAIYNFLFGEGLNTKRRRILWAESMGKNILTDKQKAYLQAQYRHIESGSAGELVGIDTFWVNVKNLGRVYQYTACDTFSSYGWAKIYSDKTSDNTVDFLVSRIIKNAPQGKIKRILTDQGTEFYSARHRITAHSLDWICKKYNIIHSITKKAHPWTNGYAERLNRTIWDEFYLCRLSKEFYSIQDLQKELDTFMRDYNFRRVHTGYKLRKLGYKYPYQAFFDMRESEDIVEIAC